MNSRFKTEKTSISFRHYVATNLQQVCLPFCLLIASICDFFVQRITPSFPRLSLRYQRWSLFSAMRFVILWLLSLCRYHPLWYQKNTIFKEWQLREKKHQIFQKQRHKWNKNCRRILINVGFSTLSFFGTMSKSEISHGTFATAEHLSCCHPDSLGPHWPGGTPAPAGGGRDLGSQIRW